MGKRRTVYVVKLGVVAGIAVGAATAASADLTIVSEVKVTGVPSPHGAAPANALAAQNAPSPGTTAPATATAQATPAVTEFDRTYTTYFKGNKARRESANGIVTIYDRDADKVYTIDQHARTYYIWSFDDAMDNGAGLPDTISSRADLSTSVDLDDANSDPDAKRTVAGIDGTKFSFFGSVTATPKSTGGGGGSGGGFGGGGRRRGGGGGGGGGGGVQNGGRVHFAHVTLSGSVWTTDAMGLLPNGKKDEKELSIALLQQELPDANPVLKPFANEMAKKKLIPIASRLSLRTYSANGQSLAYDPAASISLSAPTTAEPLVVEMNVKSIDTKTTLDDNMFKLPSGYDRVDPPAAISPIPAS